MEDSQQFQQQFFDQLGSGLHLSPLFEYLPEVYLYVKDQQSRFVRVNQALLNLRGFEFESDMLGKSDLDVHPRHLAEQYIAEDQQVMQGRVPVPNQVWLVPGPAGDLRWFLSTKIPLFDRQGGVIGIAGAMRDLARAEAIVRPYVEMEEVVTHVLAHHAERLEIKQLAAMTHLSVSQFDRRFKRLFQMTPQQYILQVRVNAASESLVHTDLSIAKIAAAAGFYDQSYFAKQFRRHTGLSPRQYRQRYRQPARSPSDA